MKAISLEDIFKDGSGLFDSITTVEYKGHYIVDNRPVVSTYTVRTKEGWIIYETSSKGTIQDCKDMVDSRLQWQAEAK